MIVRLNTGEYQVRAKSGRPMGTYKTLQEAQIRLKQVEMFSHMRKK